MTASSKQSNDFRCRSGSEATCWWGLPNGWLLVAGKTDAAGNGIAKAIDYTLRR